MPRPMSRPLSRCVGLLVAALLVLGSAAPVAAALPSAARAPQPAAIGEPGGAGQPAASAPTGRLIVRYRPGVDVAERRALRAADRLELTDELPLMYA